MTMNPANSDEQPVHSKGRRTRSFDRLLREDYNECACARDMEECL